MTMDKLFYDIEVFDRDVLIVFKDIDKNLVKSFHNEFDGLEDIVNNYILVGFNNYYYDDHILSAILRGYDITAIKAMSNTLISGKKVNIESNIKSLDCFQQIDVSKPSLKKIEGNMGKMILESSVSFDIDRPLTNDEFKEVFEYCCYDVDTTIDIFKLREKDYFEVKNQLISMLGDEKATRWNTTTIASSLLVDKHYKKQFFINIDDELYNFVPQEVYDLWEQVFYYDNEPETESLTIEEFGNDIQFGFGGLHGAHKTEKRFENVILLDVASMYPTIIKNLKILGTSTEKYEQLLEQRLRIKHENLLLSDALKLVLNSVYGNLNNKYSNLYNPKGALTVCIYGQIILYELAKRLSNFYKIININTDGVCFVRSGHDGYKKIAEAWEKEFDMTLEEEHFDLWIQKDVNNYVAVKDIKKLENGKIDMTNNLKVKGADTGRYFKNEYFKNNNARIVDIAIVNELVNDIDVSDTLIANLDEPILYQYILKAGNTYLGTFDNDGKEYNKVNRVFANNKENFVLYKKRKDGGLVKFANAPEQMFLWNYDCNELKNFNKIIDLNHYYQVIDKKLKRWS